MTTTASAVEARRNLGRLLNIVSLTHDDVVIERDGKPIARLIPCDRAPAAASAKLDLRQAAGLGKELWRQLDVDAYVREERQTWN